MALVDHLLQFSDKQAIAAGNSTNTLDTVHKSVGTAGLPVCLQGHIVAPSNATVTVTLQESNDGTTFKVNGQRLKHYIGDEERGLENLTFIA